MVGVKESTSFDLAGGVAEIFVGHALITCEVEAFFDGVRIQA